MAHYSPRSLWLMMAVSRVPNRSAPAGLEGWVMLELGLFPRRALSSGPEYSGMIGHPIESDYLIGLNLSSEMDYPGGLNGRRRVCYPRRLGCHTSYGAFWRSGLSWRIGIRSRFGRVLIGGPVTMERWGGTSGSGYTSRLN